MAALNLIMVSSCDLALGPRVNTEKPVISLPEDGNNVPGAYLQGSDNLVLIEVEQEYGLDAVFMEYWYYDLDGNQQYKKIPAVWNKNLGSWTANIDTDGMADGPIKAQITAIDVSGNKTTTTDLLYYVKNLPPQIEMNIPAIKGGTMAKPGYPTGQIPDFDDPDLKTLLEKDPVYLGFDLMGLAEDAYGIAQGYPKIMIWPATFVDIDDEDLPNPGSYYDVWRAVQKPNDFDGLKATKFSWPMTGMPPGQYRFRLVTMDLFGTENYYPNRTDNRRGPDGQAADPETLSPKYIEFSYMASDIPIIMVREIPQYYNGVGDFKVSMTISSQNPVVEVKAYITDSDTYTPGVDTAYDVSFESFTESSYTGELVISQAQAQAAHWPIPPDENLFVHLAAKDDQNKGSPPTFRTFIYDTVPPDVIFDRPANVSSVKASGTLSETGGAYVIYNVNNTGNAPKWVTGQFTTGGMSTDNFIVSKVYYHIGKLGDDDASPAVRASIYNGASWTDTKLETSFPADNWSGSPYAWSYSYNFNGFKSSNPGDIQSAGDLGLSGPDFQTTGTGYDSRFYLPCYLKVGDSAGNYRIVHYKLCIDPDLDIPQVEINYPKEDPDKPGEPPMVGGEVRVTGTAQDNNWVHTVMMRVWDAKTNAWYLPSGVTLFYTLNPDFPLGLPFTRDPLTGIKTYDATPGEIAADKEGWFRANKLSDDFVVPWYYSLNSDDRLSPSGSVPNDVRIEVRAVDTKDPTHLLPDLVGPAAKLNVKFSNDVPTIVDTKIKKAGVDPRDYDDSVPSAGNFTISMKITDADYILNATARLNNGTTYDLVAGTVSKQSGLPAGWRISKTQSALAGVQREEWTFEIDINSETFFSYGRTGYLPLEIKAENERATGNLTTRRTFNIGIDNFYPTADIQTQINASGTIFPVMGTAKDYDASSGTIQGLEWMLVYFEKAIINGSGNVVGTGVYLNPRGIAEGGTDTFYPTNYFGNSWRIIPHMEPYPNVRDMSGGGSGVNVASFLNFPVLKFIENKSMDIGDVWESPHAMVIDKQELGETTDLDEDGTFGEVWNGLVNKEWQARMDTTKFDDGPLMVHYIIMDQAGNATHYQKDIYIENNKPVIETVNLGTDINFDGTVDPWISSGSSGEFMQIKTVVGTTTTGSGKITFNPSFRIRNRQFRLMLDTTGGNGDKFFRVSYVTANPVPVNAASIVRGRVYTIVSMSTGAGTPTDWTKYGALNNNTGTTFVASGSGEGSGTVTQYTEVAYVNGPMSSAPVINNFNNIFVTDFTNIPDSSPDGIITTHDARLFIVKVYDSTVSGRPEGDQLAHAVLIGVDIDNNDQEDPVIRAAPFGQGYVPNTTNVDSPDKHLESFNASDTIPPVYNDTDYVNYSSNYNRNIVMESGIRKGYVQYAIHSGGTANISGKVIFSGSASDNQRISRISAQISGYNGGSGTGNEFTIGVWDTTSKKIVPPGTNTMANIAPDAAVNTWGFEAVDEYLTLNYGHVLNWRFAWDSSAVASMAANGVMITFKVYDSKTADPLTSNSAVDSPLTVNVVPYISEVVTGLNGAYSSNPSAFNRSAQGWYPVRESESVTIRGFNLGTAAAVNVNNTSITGTGTKNQVTFNVGTAAASGELSVMVNSIASFNNRSNTAVRYNTEPNGLNNNILTNSRSLYVWSVGSLLTKAIGSRDIEHPFMRVSSTGHRFLTYSSNVSSANLRLNNNTASVTDNGTNIESSTNRYLNLTVAADSAGLWYIGASNQTAQNYNSFHLHARGAADNQSNAQGRNKTRILSLGPSASADANRVRIPRIHARSTGTNNAMVAVSYGNNSLQYNDINFHYGSVNGASNSAWGGGDFVACPTASTNTAYTDTSRLATVQNVTNATSAHKGSMYTAVATLSDGTPVIAWYDGTAQRLLVSYGNRPADATSISTTPIASWQGRATIVQEGAGAHVDMAVDGANNVHLAYYDVDNGGLYYAFIPSGGIPRVTNTSTAQITSIEKAKVDTYLAAGTKLMINVRNETGAADAAKRGYRPYISYFHASFAETRNAIRVAWLDTTVNTSGKFAVLSGTDENDRFLGNWEVMTIPARNVPTSGYFVTNGVPTANTNWVPPTGTNAMSGYWTTSNTQTNSRINRSILVGYMADTWYEGAMLKKDIW